MPWKQRVFSTELFLFTQGSEGGDPGCSERREDDADSSLHPRHVPGDDQCELSGSLLMTNWE